MKMAAIARAVIKPGAFKVMAKKVLRRLRDQRGSLTTDENLKWLQANAVDFPEIANRLDPTLWVEAKAYEIKLRAHADAVLSTIPYKLRGSGFFTLLYFLTRRLKPQTILETGVAAGWSSHAFLSALEKNDTGHLYSSDFPYFRIQNPEKLVGILVEPRMKVRWTLEIRGDEINLPKLLASIDQIHLFHYDSDKSYAGRKFAMDLVRPKMASAGVIIMDDLQDTPFFYDAVANLPREKWYVFPRGRAFVGVIGDLR